MLFVLRVLCVKTSYFFRLQGRERYYF